MKASTLEKHYGVKLGSWHTGNNGARVLPLEIGRRPFDGAILVNYKVVDPDGKWVDGTTDPSTLYYWIGKGK